ncbi:ABC transporter permease [filamentous cyanobacterium LEGE 11480]|uniref:ABC transporter permease n=1 Tax=Romeriopsis navalis LEGE 11480 TaxID=2777977 RepID=A0A928VQD3_9CYAN|nr:ABC transporter permease [Romeriopsis navalis]MBE9030670.1 ABC transporter permease [Romeriopsis navalis LEGE 11480]
MPPKKSTHHVKPDKSGINLASGQRSFRHHQWLKAYEDKLLSLLAVISFLLAWEAISRSGLIQPIFISSPSRIWRAAQWLFANGFLNDIRVSSIEFSAGFILAILLGVPAGISLGWYRRLYALFDPFISALYATPRVALLPLLILWLGIGINSKIAVVFLGAFFPVLINTITSIKTLDPLLLKCARSFGASDRQVFTTLAIPASIPYIIAGMRLAIGRGLVGVVVGELIASTAGVGHMISVAGATFQTDKVFVGIIVLSSTGYILTELLKLVERYFERWRPKPPT